MKMSEDDSPGSKEKSSKTKRSSRKDSKEKSNRKQKIKEEKKEIKEEKPDPDLLLKKPPQESPSRKKKSVFDSKVKTVSGGGSLSEDDLSSDQGIPGSGAADPYCQLHHMPHPTLEELRDKKYLARLQVLLLLDLIL